MVAKAAWDEGERQARQEEAELVRAAGCSCKGLFRASYDHPEEHDFEGQLWVLLTVTIAGQEMAQVDSPVATICAREIDRLAQENADLRKRIAGMNGESAINSLITEKEG